MRKIGFVLLFLFVAFIGFGQVQSFGESDIWTFDPDDITVEDDIISLYFHIDMEETSWTGFNPKKSGLKEVGFMYQFSTDDPSLAFFMWAYMSDYELDVNNFIMIYDGSGDAWQFGGKRSAGDYSFTEYNYGDDAYFAATCIYPDPSWVDWFVDNPGGYYSFGIHEYSYGQNLMFQVPPELFDIIKEYWNHYHGKTINHS